MVCLDIWRNIYQTFLSILLTDYQVSLEEQDWERLSEGCFLSSFRWLWKFCRGERVTVCDRFSLLYIRGPCIPHGLWIYWWPPFIFDIVEVECFSILLLLATKERLLWSFKKSHFLLPLWQVLVFSCLFNKKTKTTSTPQASTSSEVITVRYLSQQQLALQCYNQNMDGTYKGQDEGDSIAACH